MQFTQLNRFITQSRKVFFHTFLLTYWFYFRVAHILYLNKNNPPVIIEHIPPKNDMQYLENSLHN